MAKNTESQLTTSADNGGDGGEDGIDRESMEFDEQDDRGVFKLVDGIKFRSICSRRLLKEEKKDGEILYYFFVKLNRE
jgi:hypothetical protein